MRLTLALAAASALLAASFGSSSHAASFAELDTTFGTDGIAGSGAAPYDIATDSMDRIYALLPSHPDRIVARFNADGTLDDTFGGGDGFVTLAAYSPAANSSNTTLVAIDYDDGTDTIVVGGYLTLQGGQEAMTIGRYDTSGNRVTSFDGDGFVVLTAASDAYLYTLDVLDDGSVVGGGEYWASADPSIVRDAVAVRVGADGAPDAGFGTNGIKTVDFGSACEVVRSVTEDSSGRVLLGVDVGADCASVDAHVARLLDTGAADTSFSADGIVALGLGSYSRVRLLVPRDDGGVVALATRQDDEFAEPELMAIAHFGSDGASAGSVSAGFPSALSDIAGKGGFALQADQKIVGHGSRNPGELMALFRLAGCAQLAAAGGACEGSSGGGGGGGGALSIATLGLLLLGLRRRR